MEARLSAQFTAMVEALENRVTSKAVQAGPESFGDSTEALLFVTNETVHVQGAFESWIGPITLMVSGETDISMLEQSLRQELTSHKTGNTIDQSAMIAAFKLGCSVPYLLGGEVTKRTDNKPLADIPDWEAWAGAKGSGGKRSELTKLLGRLKTRHQSMIKLIQSGKPRAIALAVSILWAAGRCQRRRYRPNPWRSLSIRSSRVSLFRLCPHRRVRCRGLIVSVPRGVVSYTQAKNGVEASVPKAKWTKFRSIVRSDLAALQRRGAASHHGG